MDTPPKNCINCKWWGRNFEPDKRGYRDCDAVNHDSPMRGFRIEVTADDDSGLTAELMTASTFGCTEFKALNGE